ncbi:hypothetical protein TRAPUB_13225 [Trametes pubescens]|uniref:Uncharacterized protein n=1 Tax=Trametes pubescens TaxID=154538 RepID=A0A1M2VRP2_TRAPU|nr:hypothetical protein TRAPUB_13225 [Trametes pubescens]
MLVLVLVGEHYNHDVEEPASYVPRASQSFPSRCLRRTFTLKMDEAANELAASASKAPSRTLNE